MVAQRYDAVGVRFSNKRFAGHATHEREEFPHERRIQSTWHVRAKKRLPITVFVLVLLDEGHEILVAQQCEDALGCGGIEFRHR